VRENRTQGSVRGLPDNRQFYLDYKMKIELANRLHQLKTRMNHSLQSRKNCHCHIIGADEKNKPYLIGTGVVLDFDSNIYIATAAHVIDENEITTIYTFLGGKQLIIEGEVYSTIKPGNDRNNDKLDIAIYKVADSLIQKFRDSYTPVTLKDIDVDDVPQSKKYYAFIGHPTNKTKPKHQTTIIKSETFSYFGSKASSSAYDQLSLTPYSHIVVGFDPNKCLDENGDRYNFPKAKGMSGGGVWLLEDLNNHSSQSYVNKLVGIGIEDHKNPKVMVGTRIGAVIEAIKNKYPDCKGLPQTNFTINDV